LTDSADLPAEDHHVDFLPEPNLRSLFLEQQHKFKPVVINCRHKLQEFNAFQRLPFVSGTGDTGDLLGQGAFGDAERIGIPARYFKEASGADYGEASRHFNGERKKPLRSPGL
jgi:hypothetical protein